jgi:tetratricopeptide (TPR) repeat protein
VPGLVRRVLALVLWASTAFVQDDASARCETQCADAMSASEWLRASQACGVAYQRNPGPEQALALARTWVMLSRNEDALRILAPLVHGSARASALQISAAAHDEMGDLERARAELREAIPLHSAAGMLHEVSHDYYVLAGTYWRQARYAETSEALDQCEASVRIEKDERMLGFIALMRSDVFGAVGDQEAWERYLYLAEQALRPWPGDYSYVRLKAGIWHRFMARWGMARSAFEEALRLGKASGRADVVRAALQHLAYISHVEGRPEDGMDYLAAAVAAGEPADSVSLLHKRALLEADQGNTAQASSLLLRAATVSPSLEWTWDIENERGRLAERVGDTPTAEAAYRRSISVLEELRREIDSSELQAWVLSRRRAPFEALFALLARQGRRDEAIAVLDACAARSLGDRLLSARGAELATVDSRKDAVRALSANAPEEIVSILRERPIDVLANFNAAGHTWVAGVIDGRSMVIDAGDALSVAKQIERLAANPDDGAAAETLGRLLLSPLPDRSGRPLYIVPLPGFLSVPYGALRLNSRYLVETRTLAFAPSFRALVSSLEPRRTHGVTVLADPRGDLPAARREAEVIARRFGAGAWVGADAARERFVATQNADLLHLGTHSGVTASEAWFSLADGDVRAADVLVGQTSARVVVLAGCASAASPADDLWGSLAAAFLAMGSQSVVATVRSLRDEDASEVVERFYARGGARDPMRALSEAQRELAARSPAHVWSAFVVYTVSPAMRP